MSTAASGSAEYTPVGLAVLNAPPGFGGSECPPVGLAVRNAPPGVGGSDCPPVGLAVRNAPPGIGGLECTLPEHTSDLQSLCDNSYTFFSFENIYHIDHLTPIARFHLSHPPTQLRS